MAIKGKGRTRSGRRVIAASPRPQLFVRKPPIWKRRWVRLTALATVLAIVAVGALFKIARDHRRAFKAKETAAVVQLSNQLFATFPAAKSTVQPDLFVFYPNLTADLDKLSKGTLSNSAANTESDSIATSATDTEQKIQAVNPGVISPTFSATTVPNATAKGVTRQQIEDAQFFMAQAFGLYSKVGMLMKDSVAASGPQRTAFVDQAKALYTQAGAIFDRGYRILLNIRQALGIPFTFPVGTPATGG
jgi:type II secretory pathway pseudopilin PulG